LDVQRLIEAPVVDDRLLRERASSGVERERGQRARRARVHREKSTSVDQEEGRDRLPDPLTT